MKLIIAAIAATIMLAGCASTEGQADSGTTAKTNQTTEPAAPEPAASQPAPEPAAPSVLKIGQAYTWEDGVSAIVVSITDRTINQSYDPKPAKIVTIQVQNGTAAVLDLALSDAMLTFGPAGTQGERGIDIEQNLTLGFTGSVPPGGTQTAEYAYVNVTDPSVLNIEFAPSWDHESAFWSAP